MGTTGSIRALHAAERRLQRAAQQRHRELIRLEKERAKLSAIEQARLEVETYENQLELLLSVHKEPCQEWDWIAIASDLPHPKPSQQSNHERRAVQDCLVAHPKSRESANAAIQKARALDEREFQDAISIYLQETADIEKLQPLALRVLAGERMAFIEAFAELNPVSEFSSVGSLRQFAVENQNLIECVFKVNANEVIPTQVKTLTAANKVSTKAMPKAQFHEIYQDYVCACVFRMAREIFAMLPVSMVLVTALADVVNQRTGVNCEQAVLSTAMSRDAVANLNFDHLSPTDAIDLFTHRGNFKVSRKAGSFEPIIPLTSADVTDGVANVLEFEELRSQLAPLREALKREMPQTSQMTS